MNRRPVSDGLQCPRCSRLHIRIRALLGIAHMLWNSVASRPPHILSVFIPFQPAYSNNSMCVCVCVTADRVGGIGRWVGWCNATLTSLSQGHF